MPYYLETDNRESLEKLLKYQACAECGSQLEALYDIQKHLPYLQCKANPKHEGIMREASEYEQKGLMAINIPTRREMMEQELGKERATKLIKYEGVVSLTQAEAMEILGTIWPSAPEVEVLKAAMVCHQYGLNPLMKHVFLIPFKRRSKGVIVGEDWVTVLGIKATRLIAHRAGNFSYLDDTPRVMTDEEQKRIFGEVDGGKIWAITKLKDSKGNIAPGYGSWPVDEAPYGFEKGNTKANMAFIRSERNALDRLFAGEMPQGIEVIDEEYGAPDTLISEGGEKIGEQADEQGGEGKPSTTISSPPEKAESQKIGVPAQLQGEGFHIDPTWLKESLKELKWTDDTGKTFLLSQYQVSSQGSLEDVIKRLTREQAEEFVKEIQNRLAGKQRELFT